MCGEDIGGRKGAQSSSLSPTLVVGGELGTGQETVRCEVGYEPPHHLSDPATPPAFAALCPDRPLPVKITQEDVKVMLNLLEEVCTAFPTGASLSLSQASMLILPWRGRSLVYFPLDYFSGGQAGGSLLWKAGICGMSRLELVSEPPDLFSSIRGN